MTDMGLSTPGTPSDCLALTCRPDGTVLSVVHTPPGPSLDAAIPDNAAALFTPRSAVEDLIRELASHAVGQAGTVRIHSAPGLGMVQLIGARKGEELLLIAAPTDTAAWEALYHEMMEMNNALINQVRTLQQGGPKTARASDETERLFNDIAALNNELVSTQRELTRKNRALEEEIARRQQAQTALIRAEQLAAVGALAAGFAHRFNNLLSPVLGYSDLLVHAAALSDKDRRRIETIQQAAEEMKNLTKDVIAFTDEANLRREPLDLAQVVAGCLAAFRQQEAAAGIAFETSFDSVPACPVNRRAIHQVMEHLLQNASDALLERATPCIAVTVGEEAQQAFIRIRDTGCGMTPDEAQTAFLPFISGKGEFAPAGSPQASLGGNGLGLTLCQHLVGQHKGEIEVESTPGTGTVFTVRLPLAQGPIGPHGGE